MGFMAAGQRGFLPYLFNPAAGTGFDHASAAIHAGFHLPEEQTGADGGSMVGSGPVSASDGFGIPCVVAVSTRLEDFARLRSRDRTSRAAIVACYRHSRAADVSQIRAACGSHAGARSTPAFGYAESPGPDLYLRPALGYGLARSDAVASHPAVGCMALARKPR